MYANLPQQLQEKGDYFNQADSLLDVMEFTEAHLSVLFVIFIPVSYTHLDVYKRQSLIFSHLLQLKKEADILILLPILSANYISGRLHEIGRAHV